MKLEDIKVGQKYKSNLFKSVVYLGIGLRDSIGKRLVIIDDSAQEEIGLIVVYNSDQKSSSKLFFDNLYEI